MIIASLLKKASSTPYLEEATHILDDLIDTGRTRNKYRCTNKPFVALYEKTAGDRWLTFPWEQETSPEDAVTRLLCYVGEDVTREGLADTPKRYTKALAELTSGYHARIEDILQVAFTEKYDEMVVVRDIPFWSLCEHHMLPFHGTATVGYIPTDKVVGLSKIPRLVHAFARRLQIQERLTTEIASALQSRLNPIGVGVVIKASHTCMQMRGVRSQGEMTTSCLLGAMRDSARNEFLDHART